ncbi:MAG: serine hydrolase [Lewinellaceae bacterium]|nr:serine hydrolase [Lewinellaceae bacterium]
MKLLSALPLILLLWSPISVNAQSAIIPLPTAFQHQLDSITAQEQWPGATLAVVLPDGQLLSLASGFADREERLPMPVGGQLFTGSTGKTFVSATILRLLDEGQLSLNDRAVAYFTSPEDAWFRRLPNAQDITIRSLLNHTSGLPRYIFQPAMLEALKADPFRSWTPRECLAVLENMAPVHPVGKGWGYSDSNYLVLGMIIEKITGDTYYHQIQEHILNPLHLRHTYPSTQPELPGLVPGYIGEENFLSLPLKTVTNGRYAMNPQFEWCGGGLVTNVEDMAYWLKWLHSGKVLSASAYQQLIQPVDFRSGQPTTGSGYGLGSFVWQTPLGTFYGHSGIMPGHLTQVEYSARYGFAIALQTNTDAGLGRRHHPVVQWFARQVAAFLRAEAARQLTMVPVDHHVHSMSPQLVATWKAMGIPFSRPDYVYTHLDSILDRNQSQQLALISMAYAFSSAEFGEPGPNAKANVQAENDYLALQKSRYPHRLQAFFGIDPLAPYAMEEVERCHQQLHLGGIKLHGNASQVYLTEPAHLQKVKAIFQYASDNRLPVILHFDNSHPRFGEADVRILADSILASLAFVDLQIAHFGTSGGFNDRTKQVLDSFLGLFAQNHPISRHRIRFDISAVGLDKDSEGVAKLTASEWQELATYVRRLGPERIVFGTDYPLYTATEYAQILLDKLELSPMELQQLLQSK